MRIPRCYTDLPLQVGAQVELPANLVQYLASVLRLKTGHQCCFFNGDGQEYYAELTVLNKRQVLADIVKAETNSVNSPLKVQIGQCLSRGERMDYAVQKSTELGMHSLQPLFSEYTEVKLDEKRAQKRLAHWQQIAISASEQSGRAQVPSILEPININDWMAEQQADLKLILHPHNSQALGDLTAPKSVAILIGPEGGLSETEVEQAKANGFQAVSLGPRVLRTETAPVAALSVLQYIWGDF